MKMSWQLVVLMALAPAFVLSDMSDTACSGEEKDPKTYAFSYGYSWRPYEYLTDDGELAGLSHAVTRAVCKIMNRDCVHIVMYNYSLLLDDKYMSQVLNNFWSDATTGWLDTVSRSTAYGFFGEFAEVSPAYMYVRRGSSLKTVQDIRSSNPSIALEAASWADLPCLENYLGITVNDFIYAELSSDQEDALFSGQVDVIFTDGVGSTRLDEMDRIDERIGCNEKGVSVMARKDMVHMFGWFDEGLQKIRDNGEYDWLCNIHGQDVDPRCLN